MAEQPRPRSRRAWRALEPVHGMIYFAAEAQEAYAALGITHHRTGYFASRSAPLGAVPAEVVIATFFNFEPGLVRRAIPAAWDVVSPEQILDARLAGADGALRRAFGEAIGSPELREVALLARRAALAAGEQMHGRPLFAAYTTLAWPDEPHLVLWHAQTLLREYRGDGHVAALTAEGLNGIEALITHGASGDVPDTALQASRSWPADDWAAAVDGLRSRGLLDGKGAFTEAGREQRDRVEARTDALAAHAYAAFTDDEAEQLVQSSRRFSRMVVAAGLLQPPPPA